MFRFVQLGWSHTRRIVIASVSVAALVILLGQLPQIIDSYVSARDLLTRSFAFGLIPLLVWAVAFTMALWKKRVLLSKKFWNKWIAALVASSVILGFLAYFSDYVGLAGEVSLGGWMGQKLIGPSDLMGVLRLIGLGVLTATVAFPGIIGKLSRRVLSVTGEVIYSTACNGVRLLFSSCRGAWDLIIRRVWTSDSKKVSRPRERITVKDAPPPMIVGRRSLQKQKSVEKRVLGIQKRSSEAQTMIPSKVTKADLINSSEKPVSRGAIERWSLPPVSLLDLPSEQNNEPVIDQDSTSQLIENTLSDYGIEVRVSEVKPGPVVTMFGLVPGWVRRSKDVRERTADGKPVVDDSGKPVVRRVEDKTRVRVDSIVAREKDLALALAAPSLRFEAPIPGASLVGIEVPNPRPAVVTLRSVIETEVFHALSSKSKLALGLGMGTGGEVAVADLARMPHLLIAGSTSSGKSVCINSVIASIIMHNSPWDTRMLLIDPKRVELTQYNGIPHLVAPVVVEVEVAVQMLKGMIQEMLRRYRTFEDAGARNIEGYNQGRPIEEKMPMVVVAVDELADLMMSAPYDIERSIIRLAQLGRATGIHLVVATQRPSVDVVTGLIKANFPGRISFAVASQVDSRTILDSVGAEKLLGRGDMLFQPQDTPKPRRIQGAFISDNEIEELVSYWHNQQGTFPPEIALDIETTGQSAGISDGDMGDEMLEKAWDLATQYNRMSTSLLQRRLRIGYPRAARLMDLLEEEGVVGPGEGGKSREVLMARSIREQD